MFNGNDLGNAIATGIAVLCVVCVVVGVAVWELGKWVVSHLSIAWTWN